MKITVIEPSAMVTASAFKPAQVFKSRQMIAEVIDAKADTDERSSRPRNLPNEAISLEEEERE